MILKFYTYRISKQKLLKRLKPMGRKSFSDIINPIVAVKRNMPIEKAKQKQFLQSNEVVEFLNKIGEPLEEYRTMIELVTHQMNKAKLRAIFFKIGFSEFTRIINGIIEENRKIGLVKSRYKKYLRPIEVTQILDEIGELWYFEKPNI